MKQAIAGVAPSQLQEVTVTIEWPTIAATGLGRFLGRLYAIRAGFWIFTLGRLFMGLTLPIGLFLFFWMLAPWNVRRYRLTNRRVIVEAGAKFKPEQFVDLNRFDAIAIEVRPGQGWYPAGDMIFKLGPVETLRLAGVGYPEAFRATCLKAHQAYVGVRKAVGAASG
ncbi:MAG TPA: PH domain-containing protein [Pirellulales bacterium]|nr:PH domain-containing protein [Pirellulales bacterium]